MASKNTRINEKEMSATVSSSVESAEANEEAVVIPERDLTRAIWTIIYAVALPSIPIVIICSILLYIIYQHRLNLNPGLSELQVPLNITEDANFLSKARKFRQEGGEWAYYVLYNPSTITTIASWTSKVIPYFSSSIMALVALFAARHIVLKSKHGDDSQLPNPEQLALLIGTLGGSGFTPLKEVVMYRFMRNGRLIKPLPAAISAFATITIMGLIIPVIDTWFGVVTTAQTVVQIDVKGPSLTYGRGISISTCPNGPADNGTANSNLSPQDAFWPCNVQTNGIDTYMRYLRGQAEASNVALGVSNLTKIFNYTDATGSTLWYMGNPTQNSLQDYRATTLATMSQCQPMTLQECDITYASDYSKRFQCNKNFAGSFGLWRLNVTADGSEGYAAANIGVAFSGNAELTEVTAQVLTTAPPLSGRINTSDPQMYMTNPLYYGVWAFGYPGSDYSIQMNFVDDPSYYYGYASGGIWLLNCSTTVYDVTYSWINGSIASFNSSESSPEMAALLSGPFALNAGEYLQASLQTAAMIAGSANHSAGIARIFAAEYSKLLLAYSVGALERQVVTAQQDRTTISNVARVPLIPLYLLIGTKAIYVLAVVILAIVAYACTHPAETELVKDHLSIKGLASAHFERPEALQEYAVQELQSRLDSSKSTSAQALSSKGEKGNSIGSDSPSDPRLRHAATDPAVSTIRPTEAKVGLMPTVNGTWQFIVKANGVWNTVKPAADNVDQRKVE